MKAKFEWQNRPCAFVPKQKLARNKSYNVLGTAIMTAVSLDSKRNTGGFPIMNKTSIGIVIAVLFGFCLILWAADAVGAGFGKIGENVALGVIAVLLVIGLIKARKEK